MSVLTFLGMIIIDVLVNVHDYGFVFCPISIGQDNSVFSPILSKFFFREKSPISYPIATPIIGTSRITSAAN